MTTKTLTVCDRAAAMTEGNALKFNREQFSLIKAQCAPDYTDDEFLFFANFATFRGLNPLAREIYTWKQKDENAPGGKKMIFVTSIDGFRKKAGESGRYNGRTAPEWMDGDGKWHEAWGFKEPPVACRIGVRIAGHSEPTVATVNFNEFFQSTKPSWQKMPCHMLAKVAESHALRAGFPDQLSGLFTDDEMDRSGGAVSASPGSKKVVNAAEMLDDPAPDVVDPSPPESDVIDSADDFMAGLRQTAETHGWTGDELSAKIAAALQKHDLPDIATSPAKFREDFVAFLRDPAQKAARDKKRKAVPA